MNVRVIPVKNGFVIFDYAATYMGVTKEYDLMNDARITVPAAAMVARTAEEVSAIVFNICSDYLIKTAKEAHQ